MLTAITEHFAVWEGVLDKRVIIQLFVIVAISPIKNN